MITGVQTLDVEEFRGAAVASDDMGIIVAVNSYAEELFGYSGREIVGHNLSMLMPEAYAIRHDAFMAHYRKNRTRRLIGKARLVNIRCKDGAEPEVTIRLGEYMEGRNLRFVGVFTAEESDGSSERTISGPTAADYSCPSVRSSSESKSGASCPVAHVLRSDGASSHSIHATFLSQPNESCPAAGSPIALPIDASDLELAAFHSTSQFLSGVVKIKGFTGRWKEHWIALDHSRKTLAFFAAKKAPKVVNDMTIRALGTPSKLLIVTNCSIRDGYGITGKSGTVSICERGDNVRHLLFPSKNVAHCWMQALQVCLLCPHARRRPSVFSPW